MNTFPVLLLIGIVAFLVIFLIAYISVKNENNYMISRRKASKKQDEDGCLPAVIVLVTSILIGFFLIRSLPAVLGPPTEPPVGNPTVSETPWIAAPTETMTPTATATQFSGTYETTWQEDERFRTVTQKKLIRVGTLLFEYSPIMQPETSETFYLAVYIPPEYASASPFIFERISLPATHAGNPNNLSQYTTNLLVYPIISAQLQSTDFQILPVDKEATKIFDVTRPAARVDWKWVVQAPGVQGRHTLALSIFIDRIPDPSWTGSFAIDVQAPTAAPVPTNTFTSFPTATPAPTLSPALEPTATLTSTPTVLQEFGDDLKHNFTTLLLWVLGVLATAGSAIFGLIKKHLKIRDRIRKLEEEREGLLQEKEKMVLMGEREKLMERIQELDKEIQRLKSIAWWQFWK